MHPWFKKYEEGVPRTIDLDAHENLIDFLNTCFKKYGNRPAYHCMGTNITYSQLERKAKKFASFLQNNWGVEPGDRVAIMMPNMLQYPIALFGCLLAGVTVVNVNPLYTARELEHQLNDSGAETIIIFEQAAHILEEVLPKTQVKNIIVTGVGDLLNFPKSLVVNFAVRHIKKMVKEFSLPSSINFRDALFDGEESLFKKVKIKSDHLAFLQYTGGTTGVSKGAMLTHANILANITQARVWIKSQIVEGEEIIITPLPLYHIFSLTVNCFIYLSVGGMNVLITNPRDLPAFVKTLKQFKFTAITGVNTLFNLMLNHKDFATVNFSSLKLTVGGGMAVQKNVADRWIKVTHVPILEGYGLTETSPVLCFNPVHAREFSGYIGMPVPSTNIKILDDDEKEVKQGESGEICAKGPQVMKGYWKRDDETKKVMTKDGFFKTGDIGYMTEDGFFKIVDRKKDMILVSGFNVYPNEVEDVVCAHPKVLECAAIGVPDEKSGEVVKIFIVKKDETLTPHEILDFCKSQMTGYKVPKLVEFRTELPKSNVGKILRKDLRS